MKDVCVLCGSHEYIVISTKLRHDRAGTVVTCAQCGLSRLRDAQGYASKLNEYYADQYAREYHEGVKKELDSLFDTFLPVQAHRVDKMRPYLRPDHRVLEVGSSTGYFLESVRPLVAEVQGLELNREEARYAAEVRGIPTTDRPLEADSLPVGHYDHICLFQVLEHAAIPIEFLHALRRFLRPRGKIHIEVPNLMDPLVWFYDVEEYRNFYYQEPHLYYFNPETLRRVCEAASYTVVNIFGFQQTSLANNLNWVFLRKPQRSRWDCIQAQLPEGTIRSDAPALVHTEYDRLLEDFNERYIQFMEAHGLTDMIFATISI
jgi:2-polyprenyl-3-methyl-5-hydroxy-6-metoxy-1,4-benzoquinol methylase